MSESPEVSQPEPSQPAKPLSQRLEQVDRQIASTVEKALREFHRSLGERVRQGSDEMLRLVEGLTPELPKSFFAPQELSAAAEEKAVGDVVEAVARIDAAGTQGEILMAMLEEGRRFASRTAFFLTRPGEARGWASQGFGRAAAAIEGLHLDYGSASSWAELARGEGVVTLDGDRCAEACQRLGAPAGGEGALIPFVLRGQLGGALYADRLEGEGALAVSSLQLLAHAAALAVETAAGHGGVASPTLRFQGAAAAGVPLWQPSAEAAPVEVAPVEVAEAAPVEVAEAAPVEVVEEPPALEPVLEAVPEDTTPVEVVSEPSALEPEVLLSEPAPVPEIEPPPPVIEEPVAPAAEDVAALEPEPLAEEELFEEPGELEEDVAEPDLSLDDTSNIWALEDEEEDDEPTQVGQAVEPEAEMPGTDPELIDAVGQQTVRLDVEAIQGQTPAFEPPSTESETAQVPTWEVEQAPVAEQPDFELEPEPEPSLEPEDAPAIEPSEEPTLMTPSIDPGFAAPPPEVAPPPAAPAGYVPPAPEVAPPAPAFTEAAPTPPKSEYGSTEVQPPKDVEGPGLAFASQAGLGEGNVPEGEEALHEEARRLARLLVSEIKLYNEEIIEEGRRSGNVYERLKDDIDRSRQMYEERIDPRLKGQSDYFRQELVQRLAGGDERLLGL